MMKAVNGEVTMGLLKMSQPMRVLVSRNTEEWYTPREIIERVRAALDEIGGSR